jgi:hypothetical protein
MKPVFQFAIAMTFVIIAGIAAGCTDAPADVPHPETTPVITPPATPAAPKNTTPVTSVTAASGCAYPPLNPWTWVPESYMQSVETKLPPAPGTPVSKADLFGTPSLGWEEYEYFQQIRNLPDSYGTSIIMKERENSGLIHENHTYGIRPEGEPLITGDFTIDDMYYDRYGNMQSMHRQVIRDNDFLEDRDYPPVVMDRGTPDCSGDVFSPGLSTPAGSQ